MGEFPTTPSEIPGAPPGGVSQPLQRGGYLPVGRFGNNPQDAVQQIAPVAPRNPPPAPASVVKPVHPAARSAATAVPPTGHVPMSKQEFMQSNLQLRQLEQQQQALQQQHQALLQQQAAAYEPPALAPVPAPPAAAAAAAAAPLPPLPPMSASGIPARDPETGQLPAWNDPMLKHPKFNLKDVNPADVPLPATRSTQHASLDVDFESVDGNSYVFHKARTRAEDPAGSAYNISLVNMLAMMEMLKGGDPLRVFEAFKVRISDAQDPSLPFFDWESADYYRQQVPAYDEMHGDFPGDETQVVPGEDGYDGMEEPSTPMFSMG